MWHLLHWLFIFCSVFQCRYDRMNLTMTCMGNSMLLAHFSKHHKRVNALWGLLHSVSICDKCYLLGHVLSRSTVEKINTCKCRFHWNRPAWAYVYILQQLRLQQFSMLCSSTAALSLGVSALASAVLQCTTLLFSPYYRMYSSQVCWVNGVIFTSDCKDTSQSFKLELAHWN